MVQVYLSRYSEGVTGNDVSWEPGEKVIIRGLKSGKITNATIMSGERMKHPDAPGEMVMEVMIEGESSPVAVLAKQIEPRDGWPTPFRHGE